MAATDRVYLRDAPAQLLPAPVASTGVLGWMRANLFSSPGNIALTIICVAAIVWIVPSLPPHCARPIAAGATKPNATLQRGVTWNENASCGSVPIGPELHTRSR